MIEVTIKTLDSKTQPFSTSDDITVQGFKEQIAEDVKITANLQRLIYQGRVLQDGKKLSEYNVDGKVIHLVERPPPSKRPATSTNAESSSSTSSSSHASNDSNIFVGSISLPSDLQDQVEVQRIVQQVVSDMGELGRNARVTSRSSPDGSSVDVHINLGQVPIHQISASQVRINQSRNMIRQANAIIDRLENPPQQAENQTEGSSSESGATASSSEAANSVSSAATEEEPMVTDTSDTTTQEDSQGGARASNTQSGTSSRGSGQSIHPPITAMADILDEVMRLNERLRPHMESYRDMMRADLPYDGNSRLMRDAQRSQNLVGQVMHLISHVYHSLSDCGSNMTSPPPRNLRVPQTGPPVPIQISLPPAIFAFNGSRQGGNNQQSRDINANQTMPPGQDQNHNQTGEAAASQASASTPESSSTTGSSTTTSTPTAATTRPTTTASTTNPRVSNMVVSNTQTIVISPQGISNIPGPPPRMMGAQQPQGAFGRGVIRPGRGGGSNGGASIHIHQVPHQGGPITPQVMSALMGAISGQLPGVQMTGIRSNLGPIGSRPNSGPAGARPNSGSRFHLGPRPASSSGGPRPSMSPGLSVPASSPAGPRPASSPAPASSSNASATTASSEQGAQPSGSRSSTTTTSTNSTSSSTSSRSQTAPTGANQQRAHSPLGMFNLLSGNGNSFDAFLPCQSRHIPSQSQGTRPAPAPSSNVGPPLHGIFQDIVGAFQNLPSQQQQQQSSRPQPTTPSTTSQGTSSSTSSTNSQSQTRAQASSIANAFIGTFMNQQTAGGGSNSSAGGNPFAQLLLGGMGQGRSATGTPNASTSTGNQNRSSSQQSGTTSSEGLLELMQQFARRTPNMSPGSGPNTGNGPTSSSQQSNQAPSATETMFFDLVQGISEHVAMAATGQDSALTIHQFLSGLDQSYAEQHVEGFFYEAFDYYARNFTMTDLSHLIFGRSEPLQQNRQSLRRFVNEKVLRGRQPSEENITLAVNEIALEVINQLEEDAPEITSVREGVDIKATNLKFVQSALLKMVKYILDDHDPSFGVTLHNMIRDSLHRWIVLNIYCMNGQQPVLDTMVACMRTWMGNINSGFSNIMISMTTQNFGQIISNLSITEADILEHVVRTDTQQEMERESEAVASSTSEVERKTSRNGNANSTQENNRPDAMEVDDDANEASANLVSSTVSESEPDRSTMRQSSRMQANGVDSTGTVLLGTERWHASVPVDWVPVIERDINRQRRQAPQAAFSDAYLSTLPPKRIKLMQDTKAHIQNGTDKFLEESLSRAVSSAGVQPTTSLSALMQDVREDEQLQAACEDQVKNVLKQRIQKDTDYDATRFPSTEKYLRK
ncbi:large proline-rich protein BAG6-like isoform X2 [Antedon mediterranea]|uniref:large proline-rich protein BAG6-like isoform X2 n=1 Tax=Antedon mediterranea TaxID=105859 RepID=UPI003AF529E8